MLVKGQGKFGVSVKVVVRVRVTVSVNTTQPRQDRAKRFEQVDLTID